MLWSAMLCAFFGFLRISEFTAARAKSFCKNDTLCITDVTSINNNNYAIQIKTSKTDPFRVGVQVRISANQSVLCPVQALRKHLSNCPQYSRPLFVFNNGHYLTRQSFSKVLQELLPEHNNLSTHSFRIGAATTAAAMGLPRWLIKSLGRWNSDCFRQYIRIPQETFNKVSTSLVQQSGIGQTFDPDLA